ncbi:hypothetical protein QYE76_051556 [Lolium multiflorum]|uniref:Uncharacterized protein n=1 Tax=Lolium multiflorum TaxID=4521 RepID=A0AAD8WI05_LOLMU|nr:hypothetical protein QYE76_051556 [Lolium multiflorum]
MEEGDSFFGRTMGSSVTGTIFGRRRGRVHLALQTPRAPPALMVELGAYSTGAPVRPTPPELSPTHLRPGGHAARVRVLPVPDLTCARGRPWPVLGSWPEVRPRPSLAWSDVELDEGASFAAPTPSAAYAAAGGRSAGRRRWHGSGQRCWLWWRARVAGAGARRTLGSNAARAALPSSRHPCRNLAGGGRRIGDWEKRWA